MGHHAGFILLLIVFMQRDFSGHAQISGGLNLSNRRITPPRIAPPRARQQQPQQPSMQQQQQQPAFNQFAPNPAFLLARRLNNLESEMRRMSGTISAVSNNLRVTLSTTLAERLGHVQQEIQGFGVRIDDNQENVDQLSQELKYIQNSNANMQKRMDRIEATQNRQDETIQDVARALEAFQQNAPEATSDGSNDGPSHSAVDSRLTTLSKAVKMLDMRMNDTDNIIEGYDSYFQSFASNIDMLSRKAETLLGDNMSTSQTLSQLREEVYNIQTQVESVVGEEDRTQEVTYDNAVFGDLQMAVDELNESVRTVEDGQQRHEAAIQNLTSLIESPPDQVTSDYPGDSTLYGDEGDTQMVIELATSVAGLEESLKQIKENQVIEFGQFNLRLSELDSDVTSRQDLLSELQTRIEDFETNPPALPPTDDDFPISIEELFHETPDETSYENNDVMQNIQLRLDSMNRTLLQHNEILLDLGPVSSLEVIPGARFSSRNFGSTLNDSSTDDDDYFVEGDEVHNFSYSDTFPSEDDTEAITPGLLEQRIRTLQEDLQTSIANSNQNVESDLRNLQNSVRLQSSRLGTVANSISAMEQRLSSNTHQSDDVLNGDPSSSTSGVKQNTILQLRQDINALNTSVAIQSSMLSQGLRAMGDYDRRMRQQEEQESARLDELTDMRLLLQNATESLSQMSLSVAQHELTIPSIFDSLQTGDNILLDLNQQIYDHEIALESLNATLSSLSAPVALFEAQQGHETLQKSPTLINEINGDTNAPTAMYVTQEEFSALADALAGIAGRVDFASELYRSLKSRVANISSEMTSMSRLPDTFDPSLPQVWKEIVSVKGMLTFQQNIIESVSNTNNNITREVIDINALLTSLRHNLTLEEDVSDAGLGDGFIQLLDASVRELRAEVIEQRKWLGNQRRRIRHLEGMKLQMCARNSDVSALNETLANELTNMHVAMETMTSDFISRCEDLRHANGSSSSAVANLRELWNLTAGSIDDQTSSTVDQLQSQLAVITQRLDNYKANSDNQTEEGRSPNEDSLYNDLRTVPVALRILEAQVHGFQEALQLIPKLNAKVETLNSMRNLVFQNAGAITSFHQSVADLEAEINSVNRKLASIEFSNGRLNAYQDDLRSQVNNSRRMLDRTDDRAVALSQKITQLSHALTGNTTELRDRTQVNEVRLDDTDRNIASLSGRVDNIDNDIQQQASVDLIRHNDLDARLARDEKRLEIMEESTSSTDDAILTLTRSLSEETNTRRLAIAEHNDEISSLHGSVSGLEAQGNKARQSTTQQSQRLMELSETQARNSGELARLQTSYRSVTEDVQGVNAALVTVRDDITLHNGRINNVEDGLVELRESLSTHSNNLMSTRQTLIAVNDEVNSVQISVQRHDAFMRRAEQTIEKHRSDISFIVAHSSNHSVAIERLKQRIGFNSQETFSNITQEILGEMELLDYNLQGIRDEINVMKRQETIRQSSTTQLEGRLSELVGSSIEYQNKIRSNKDSLDRVKNDVNRYQDRVRDIENRIQEQRTASHDLQQVVISNRNELVSLGDVRSGLDRNREEFARSFANQENKTRSLQRSHDQLNGKVSGINRQVSDHENTLRNLRQDRIGFEASIDDIVRSSSSLEQLLRVTVTDLGKLKRDFNAAGDMRSTVQGLDRRTSQIQSGIRSSIQTVTTNENKIDRIQEEMTRLSSSLSDVYNVMQDRTNNDRSREHTRSGEIREMRGNLDRTSMRLRTVQNELQRHNERLHLLNDRVIDVDNRVSQAQPHIPQLPSIPQVPQQTSTTEITLEDDNTFLASSGWIDMSDTSSDDKVSVVPIPDLNTMLVNQSFLSQIVEPLVLHVDELSSNIAEIFERLNEEKSLQTNKMAQLDEKINASASINQRTHEATVALLSLVSSMETDVEQLAMKVNSYGSGLVDDLISQVKDVNTRLNAAEAASQNALSASQRVKDTCKAATNKTSTDVAELESVLNQRFAEQAHKRNNLTSAVLIMGESVRNLRERVDANAVNNVTQDDVAALHESLIHLEDDITFVVSRLHDISTSMSTYDELLLRKSDSDHVHSDVINDDKDLEAKLIDQLRSFSNNVTVDIGMLRDELDSTSATLSSIVQRAADLESRVSSKSTNNHTHGEVEFEILLVSGLIQELQTQVTSLTTQLSELDRQRAEAYDALSEITVSNQIALDSLSSRIVDQSNNLEIYNAAAELTNQNMLRLRTEMTSLLNERQTNEESNPTSAVVPQVVASLVLKLVEVLEKFNSSSQSIMERASSLSSAYQGFGDYTPNYEEEESDYDSEEEHDDVNGYGATETNSVNYGEPESVQGILTETNQNFADAAAELSVTLREIARVITDTEQPASDQTATVITENSQETRIPASLTDVITRITALEESILSPSASSSSQNDDIIDAITANISMLSDEISHLAFDRAASFGKNQNLTLTLWREVDHLRNDLLRSNTIISDFRRDLSRVNVTLSSHSAAEDMQDLSVSNLVLMQDKHARDIRECKEMSRGIGSRLENATANFNSEILQAEKRSTLRLKELKEQLELDQESTMSELLDLVKDVTSVNSTVESLLDFESDLQEEMRLRTSGVDMIRIIQTTVDQHSVLISNLKEMQREQETVLGRFELTSSTLLDQFNGVTDDVTNLNSDLEWARNHTEELLDIAWQRTVEAGEDIRQELGSVSQRVNDIQDNADSALLNAKVEIQDALLLVEGRINGSLRKTEQDIRTESENLAATNEDMELTLTRHNMELKGLSRTLRASEELLQTVTDTVTLNGNQLTLLTSEILRDGGRQTEDVQRLTELTSNHSLQIDEIEDQISLILTRVQNPTSVRIVVPPVGPIQDVIRTTTTQAPTTTSTQRLIVSPPSSLFVTSTSPSELIVSWTPASDSSINEYRIIIENTLDSRDVLQIAAVGPPVTVPSLTPSTRYSVTLYSVLNQQLSNPVTSLAETSPRPSARPATSQPTTVSTTHPTTSVLTTIDSNAIGLESLEPFISPAESAALYCDFESENMCGFLDDTADDFDWTRHNGSTPSSDTGPSRDHTFGTDAGFYMFIEASRPRQIGHVARLLSPLMESSDGQCLEFYYHMYGVGTGDLNVMVELADGSSSTRVWSESGNHGNQWKRAKVTISSDYPFRLVFEAVRGSDYHADTGLDDVIVRHDPCPLPVVQCNFERLDLCGFFQDIDDDFDWERNSGATSSADTGPITDHTTGNVGGSYLYLESSNPRYPGETTRLSSPLLGPTTAQCLQFYYHMHGTDIGELNVYIRQQSSPGDLGSSIWTKAGPQGNDWTLGRTSIVSTDSFQIVLEGVRGDDYHGDIAIDDITITDGLCDQPVCTVGVKFGDLCYKVEKDGKSYPDAIGVCASNGGLLATVKTQSQQDFISNLISSEGNRWTLFWIGLDDRVQEGRFMFSDDTPLDVGDGSFGAWAQDEPNDALGDEDCVNMEYATKHRLWNDVPCNRELWFICQYSVTL